MTRNADLLVVQTVHSLLPSALPDARSQAYGWLRSDGSKYHRLFESEAS